MKATVVVFLVVLSFATLSSASNSCTHEQMMSVGEVCHKIAGDRRHSLYRLCWATFNGDLDFGRINEVSLYVDIAAQAAMSSHNDTIAMANDLLKNASLQEAERVAYAGCVKDYSSSRRFLRSMTDRLEKCSFRSLRSGYSKDIAGVERCRNRLVRLGMSSPLHEQIVADRSKSVLASSVGAFLV